MRIPAIAVLFFLAFSLAAQERGVPVSHPHFVVPSGDGLFFVLQWNDIWWTDGESRVHRIGFEFDIISEPPVVLDGWMYVLVESGSRAPRRLYRTDGARVELVRSFENQLVWGLSATRSRLFYFTRSDYITDPIRLWSSDGTAEGTRVVTVLPTDETRGLVSTAAAVLFKLYASPRHERYRTDYDVWTSDGTASGTGVLLKDVPTLVPFRDVALYLHGGSLWRTDGTAAGTFAVGTATRLLNTWRDVAYFADEKRVFQTDGTPAGTAEIASLHFAPAAAANLGTRIVAFDDRYSRLDVHVIESGRSRLLRTFEPKARDVGYLQIGNVVFFRTAIEGREEVWRTDGTAEGTYRIGSYRRTSSPTTLLYEFKGRLLFWAHDGVHGFEPRISEGRPDDARLIGETLAEGTIRGRVTDAATGAPLTGALVDVYRGGFLIGTEPVDGDGRYNFEGVLGTHLSVQARGTAGHLTAKWPQLLEVKPGQVIENIDIAVPAGGRIGGRVVDPAGKPLAGATVHFTKALRAVPAFQVTTAADGRYLTHALEPGAEWIVIATHPRYSGIVYDGASCAAGCDAATPVTPVAVRAGELRGDIDFALEPQGRVKGKVIDELTGEPPLVPFKVSFWSANESPSMDAPRVVLTTNANGEFEGALPDGRYWSAALPATRGSYTEVWYPNFTCTSCILPVLRSITPVAGDTVTIEYRTQPLGARLYVRVVDSATGAPLVGVPVRVVSGSGQITTGTTGANGEFVTPPYLKPGVYYVQAQPSAAHLAALWDGVSGRTCDFCPDRDATPIPVTDKEILRIELRVERGAVIRGRVVDAATGVPLSASVNAQGKYVSTVGGRFEITGLYPGEHRLETFAYNYERASPRVTVARGATIDVEIALHAACRSTIDPAGVSLPAEGGTGSFEVHGGCEWRILGTTPGISARREGNSVTYIVGANRLPIPRTLQIFIEGAAFTVQQSADFAAMQAQGGRGSFEVTSER